MVSIVAASAIQNDCVPMIQFNREVGLEFLYQQVEDPSSQPNWWSANGGILIPMLRRKVPIR